MTTNEEDDMTAGTAVGTLWAVTLDCADPIKVATFWSAALGRPIDDDEMMEVLAAYPGHRQRAVRLVELSGAQKPKFGPRMPVGDIRAI